MFISIVGSDYHMGMEVYRVGQILKLKKEHDNNIDEEAIKVVGDTGATYGYVANSVKTMAKGTHSAGYIYRDFDEETTCKVMFITSGTVIAELL